MDVRKGPWKAEEDSILFNYINTYGEGRWNSVANVTGLKRTGKSCRLRWLNYLRPNVKRGNITLREQLLILQLYLRWGNRWSKIAQFLPGRTDNEIKNYWRTRVQKQAKQLKCDVNSKQFRDAMCYQWMPRLVERIQALPDSKPLPNQPMAMTTTFTDDLFDQFVGSITGSDWVDGSNVLHDQTGPTTSSDSSDVHDPTSVLNNIFVSDQCNYNLDGSGFSTSGSRLDDHREDFNGNWLSDGDCLDSLWSEENTQFFQHELWDIDV